MMNRRQPAKKTPGAPHNRVYVRLAPSKIHGVGVFAIRKIKKGTYIFHGDDEQMVWLDRPKFGSLPRAIRKLYADFAVIKNGGTRYGCPRNFNVLTVGWYLNHSDSPDVGCDEEHDYDFYALRDIPAGEELTVDYTIYSE
jgi:SET domain-containing protein